MEELFIALVVFSILALLFGGSILGIVAFFKTQRLQERMFRLQEIARDLELRRSAPAPEEDPESSEPEPAEEEAPAAPQPTPTEREAHEPEPAAEAAIERVEEKRVEREEAAQAQPPKKGVEWEKLLGVQGAAILGGIVLLFTAILFFKYAIDEGWFTREARVWTGLVAGSLCFLFQARLRKKDYKVVADVLAGSGAVIHYTSAWAGFKLYHLFPIQVGFGWMALVTAICCWLAVRHSAQKIAIFGLVGGFATPLLLATDTPSAIGLFGYILILDMALLAIGRKQDWPWLGLLGLFGTTGSQVLWLISGREEEAALGLLACGLFGILFVTLGSPKATMKDLRWQLGRVAGVMIPFAIAIYYAQHVELGDNFLLIASVSTLLAGAATYVGRRLELAGLSLAASAAAAAVSSTWLFSRTLDESALITFAALTGAASVIIALVDARTRREEPGELHPAAVHSLVLLFSLAFTVSFLSAELSLWGVLLALGVHLSVSIGTRASLPALPALAGIATGFTLLLYRTQHVKPENPNFHGAPALLLGVLALSGALLFASLRWKAHPSRRALSLSALLTAAPSLLTAAPSFLTESELYWKSVAPPTIYGMVALLALVTTWSAARTASSIAYGIAVLVISWALYAGADPIFYEDWKWSITATLPWLYLGTAIATLGPLLAREQLKGAHAVGLTAGLAPVLAAAPLLALHEHQLGERGALLVFLALAALPALAYKLLPKDEQGATRSKTAGVERARTSYLLIASGLLAFAVPAELRNFNLELLPQESTLWLLPALALAAAAASLVARSRESAAATATVHLAFLFAGVGLCIFTFNLGDLHRQESYLFNWLSYLYGVGLLSGLFVMRNTSTAEDADEGTRRYLVACTGGLTCLLGFAWLNLLLINGYSDGEHLDISSADLNRDLVLSLSWALYSFSLLALGARRGIAGLRWASLAFLFATIVKVFLFDLGNLEGLQRVGSFLGLAICLIVVSLFYSRFVFKKTEDAEPSA